MNKYKVYVPVTVDFDDVGHMIPKSIIWEDGHRFIIDKILDVRPAAAMKAGGQGRWLRQTIWCAPTGCWMSS